MKRHACLSIIAILCAALISWGFKGHKAVATIAENHLTSNVKQIVDGTLDIRQMSDVASWADEVRNQPEYRHTAPLHFLNLPLGLNQQQFEQAVKAQPQPNVYTAIMDCEKELSNKQEKDWTKRQEALKFLIHFVGDAHQPMHVSRAEDKGGNTIQVRFDDRGTNLHSVWDTKLIDREGLSDEQIVKEYDTATPGQIKRWQADGPLVWLWESYQVSSKLYAEVGTSNNLGDDYYRSHIGIVHDRIERAGIRLAGELNRIFKDSKMTARTKSQPPPPIDKPYPEFPFADIRDLSQLIGEEVTTTGKVYGHKDLGSMILVDVGAPYPDQLLTVVLKGVAMKANPNLDGKTIKVQGKIINYKGKPEMVVTDTGNIAIQ